MKALSRREVLVAGASTAALAACGGGVSMSGPMTGTATASSAAALPEGLPLLSLPLLTNMNASPGTFSAALRAATAQSEYVPGRMTATLAYNGASPGPTIEATEGDRISIDFDNAIPGQPSTIHWHGLPVPADQDGNPMDPVASGARRTYEFTLPADCAGTYWYHPHAHQLTAEQVARGLAGVFIVRPRIDPLPGGIDEHVLLVTDLRVDATGTMMGWTIADMMNGREGDQLLVNGRRNPMLDAAPGATLRLRLVNATSARYVRIALDGAPMTLIGTDGGLLAAPVAMNEWLLAPAERIDVIAQMPASTATPIALRLLPHDRGWMMMPGMASAPMLNQGALLTIRLQGSPKPAVKLPALLRSIAPLPAPIASKQLVLTERVGMMGGASMMSGGMMGWQFLINGRLFDPNRIDLVSNAGDVEQWELVNASSMDHPIHIHGTQFQVVEREAGGVRTRPAYLAWKDTVNVPRGTTVRLRVRQTMPGLRMFHCHILEHEDQGMMGVLRVQ